MVTKGRQVRGVSRPIAQRHLMQAAYADGLSITGIGRVFGVPRTTAHYTIRKATHYTDG